MLYCNCIACEKNQSDSLGAFTYCTLPISDLQVGSTGVCVNYLKQAAGMDFSKMSTKRLSLMLFGTPGPHPSSFKICKKLYREFLKRVPIKERQIS